MLIIGRTFFRVNCLLCVFALLVGCSSFQGSIFDNKQIDISVKTTADRIAEHGYPVESHDVHTEDGYISTVFRIPYSHRLQNQEKLRPIVILQHGILSNSDSWVLTGPENALAFLLSDAGFDVWLANSRGNSYAQKHERLSSRQSEFWRFTTHELGYYDIPALIDYALAVNEGAFESLYFVGYSQGTTAGFIMLASRPEIEKKIKMALMLAPVAYIRHLRGVFNVVLPAFIGQPGVISSLLGNHQVLPENDLFLMFSYNACDESSPLNVLCLIAFNNLQGDHRNLNKTAELYMTQTHPAGISTNQILHGAQMKRSGCFCRYDLGPQGNKEKYGQLTPPDYNLTAITTTFHLWYGDNDAYSTKEDVQKLIGLLPNRFLHHIPIPNWDHQDFILANELRELINEPLVNILKDAETTL